MNNNNVIYKVFCKDCDASYVNQIKRKLKTRKNKKNRFNLNKDMELNHILTYSINLPRKNKYSLFLSLFLFLLLFLLLFLSDVLLIIILYF